MTDNTEALPPLPEPTLDEALARWQRIAARKDWLSLAADLASARAALAAQQGAQVPQLPENETPEMHDAVMDVLYRGASARTRTNELWQAYRGVLLSASPQAPAQPIAAAPSAQAEPVAQPDRFAPQDEALIRRAVLSYARDVLGDERNRAYRIAQVLRMEAQRREVGAQAEPQVPLHITVLVDWLAVRYRAAGGKDGITDVSAFAEEVMRWTESAHGIGKQEGTKA